MSNGLMVFETFSNEELGQIGIAFLNDEPIFNLYDVCFNLGYTSKNNEGRIYLYKNRIEKICLNLKITGVDTVSTNKIQITKDTDFENTWINEEAFYDLCLESKAKKARAFRKWVTGEVLPGIRKEGAYITNKANPEMLREKANELESLSVVNETIKLVMDRVDKLPVSEESKALIVKQIVSKAGINMPDVMAEEKYYDGMQIAREVGVFSNTNKPHVQAINAILKQIDISDNEKKTVWETSGSWQGTVVKYTYNVIEKVRKWLEDNNKPQTIKSLSGKSYKVNYSEVA